MFRFRTLIGSSVVFAASLLLIPAPARAQDSADAMPSLKMPSSLDVSPFAADLSSATAARASSQGFGVGAKVGPLFSSFSSDTLPNYSNRTGLIGGLWFGGNRGGVFGVMGELLYAKKGASLKNASTNVDLYYLEIPILMRINIGSGSANGARVYLLAGPVADVLLKGKQGGIDVKDNYESLDVGAKFGVGVEYLRMLFEVQENIGLRNVLKSNNAAAADKIHTRTFAVLVGVRFN